MPTTTGLPSPNDTPSGYASRSNSSSGSTSGSTNSASPAPPEFPLPLPCPCPFSFPFPFPFPLLVPLSVPFPNPDRAPVLDWDVEVGRAATRSPPPPCAGHEIEPAPVGGTYQTYMKRRKLNLKHQFVSSSPYCSLKRSIPGAFNVGLIGSTCTALPGCPGRRRSTSSIACRRTWWGVRPTPTRSRSCRCRQPDAAPPHRLLRRCSWCRSSRLTHIGSQQPRPRPRRRPHLRRCPRPRRRYYRDAEGPAARARLRRATPWRERAAAAGAAAAGG